MTTIQTNPKNAKQSTTTSTKPAQAAKPTTPNGAKAEKPKKERPTIAVRTAVLLTNVEKRVAKTHAKVSKWHSGVDNTNNAALITIAEALTTADKQVRAAITALRELPSDFTGRAPKGAKRVKDVDLSPGTIVGIRDNARKDYEDILEPGEFDDLTVVRVKGKQIIVRASTGTKLIMKRGLLEVRQ